MVNQRKLQPFNLSIFTNENPPMPFSENLYLDQETELNSDYEKNLNSISQQENHKKLA